MRWEDLYDELYDADDRAEIEQLKTRLLTDLKAHRLAQARKSRGLTQRDVAAAMGLSVGRVSQIERGEVTSGDPVLIIGFGAGLTYAAQVILAP